MGGWWKGLLGLAVVALFSGAAIYGRAFAAPRANPPNVDLKGKDLSGADLQGANLKGANLKGAKGLP